MSSDLENAIRLIRSGQKGEAQKLLQSVIKGDPKNIQAWFWYVETCATNEKRIQALEMCLKFNPGNVQASQALQKFRAHQPAVSANFQPPNPKPPAEQPQAPKEDDIYSYDPRKPLFTPRESITEPRLRQSASVPSYSESNAPSEFDVFDHTPKTVSQKKPWELDPSEYVDNSMLSRNKKPVQTYSAFDVWATVLTVQDVEAYEEILRDPRATLGRAFGWVALAGLVSALAFPVIFVTNPQVFDAASSPEFQNMATSGDATSFLIFLTFFMLIFAPISGIINLAITGGVQNLVAGFFGGTGNYTRTVYALAAFIAPITMLVSLITIIPVVGQCLAALIGFYNLILNIRALRAAHSLTTGAAIGVLLAPGLIVMIFACLLAFLLSGAAIPQM